MKIELDESSSTRSSHSTRAVLAVCVLSLFFTAWRVAHAHPVSLDTAGNTYKRLQHPSTESEHARNMPNSDSLVVYTVSPGVADPSVKHFLRDSYAMFDRKKSTAGQSCSCTSSAPMAHRTTPNFYP